MEFIYVNILIIINHGIQFKNINNDLANKQNKIIIEIHDDGRGIDLQKIVNRALEKGLITPKEADFLSAEQIMNIIFK